MDFTSQIIQQLAKEHYGLLVNVKPLNGYDELNFLLTDDHERKYIFKVATDAHGYDFLDAQVCIVAHLAQSKVADKFQKYLKNKNGQALTTLCSNGTNYYLRVLTYLEGDFWVNANAFPDELFLSLGSLLGEMDNCLQEFKHLAMHRYYEWDIANALDAEQNLQYIKNHEKRRIAAYFLLQFRSEVSPLHSLLRKAYIHNDANDYNLLTSNDAVIGLIDFGDMVYSYLINNLAIACTYAMFQQADVLSAATLVVRGYHEQFPLTEQELSVLYYLIAGRLCISVTRSAYNASLNSDNEHHFITENHAWELLYKLLEINPI